MKIGLRLGKALALLLWGGVLLCGSTAAQADEPNEAKPVAAWPLEKFEPVGDGVYHGAALPDFWSDQGLSLQQDNFQKAAGKNLAILTWYANLFERGQISSWPQLYKPNLERVRKSGAVSLIKFRTNDFAYHETRKEAAPGDIARGVYDEYFAKFADTIKEFGSPVFISINDEMNGNWYSYSQDHPDTNYTAADYVAMWRHIVDVFRQRGVNNVAWVWTANVPNIGSTPFTAYYPGADYVDWIGVDFYSGNPIGALDEIYRTYSCCKPFFVAEWATSADKNKYHPNFPGEAQWMESFFEALETRYPRVKAISWFQWNRGDGDYSLQRVPAQQEVYQRYIQKPRYLGHAEQLLQPIPAEAVTPEGVTPDAAIPEQ